MRKIFIILVLLALATPCFARTDVLSNQGTYVYDATTSIGATAFELGTTTPIISIYLKPSITNTGIIYIGDSGVTAATGLELASGAVLRLDMQTVKGLYAISNVASQKLNVMIVY